jgi:hypothetical protein
MLYRFRFFIVCALSITAVPMAAGGGGDDGDSSIAGKKGYREGLSLSALTTVIKK